MSQDFHGSVTASMDVKGRVIFPAVYRDQLAEGFVLMYAGGLRAVFVYPQSTWHEAHKSLALIAPEDAEGMRYKRYIYANSFFNQNMDAQGRVLIPAQLREKAGLTRDICFLGVGDHLELWDDTESARELLETEQNMRAYAAHVDARYNAKP